MLPDHPEIGAQVVPTRETALTSSAAHPGVDEHPAAKPSFLRRVADPHNLAGYVPS